MRQRQRFRQAEVEHLGLTAVGDHDVGRLDVAMDDARGMRRREPAGDLLRELEHAIDRHAAARDQLVERAAAHQLHDEEVDPVRVIHFVDRDDVRVIERGCGARLLEKPIAPIAIARRARGDDLDGHDASQTRVDGAVDDTHAALPDQVFNPVMREGRTNHGPHPLSMRAARRRASFC